MATMSFEEKMRQGTIPQGIQVVDISVQSEEAFQQKFCRQCRDYYIWVKDSGTLIYANNSWITESGMVISAAARKVRKAVKAMKPYSDRDNKSTMGIARCTTRRLVVLFDVVITILLIILLGDGEDDLRLHPTFRQSIEAWWRL